jgi:predicted amidohydrolase
MILAAAQISPKDGEIEYNLKEHYRLIRMAAEHSVQLIVFPEMSITGYVKALANELAFRENDSRLEELRRLSVQHNMIIVAGAPVRIGSALHIGSFILSPDNSVLIYTKQFLHTGEEKFFSPGSAHNPMIRLGEERIAFAICADIANPMHPANAHKAGCTMYTASICYTPGGIGEAYEMLGSYAKEYSMSVLMSNFCGASGGHEAGGKSALWSGKGSLAVGLDAAGAGLVIGQKKEDSWDGFCV